jgi:hypothetical protein
VSTRAAPRAEPLVVRLRWRLAIAILAALLAVIALLVVVRRGELDGDEELLSAVTLVLCAWLFVLGSGILVRSVVAGHALKVDDEGLHVPGAAVVPWSAVKAASFGDGGAAGRTGRIVVHTQGLPTLPMLQSYERYVVGPTVGLRGFGGRVTLPLAMLAVDGEQLLGTIRAFAARARAQARAAKAARPARVQGGRR